MTKNNSFKTGSIYEGFLVTDITTIEIPPLTLYSLEDTVTGAKYLHAESDDDENSFAVAFRTVPKDSTGIAHILEHVVLCGSQRYNVNDPFFSMLKRSLCTFMNAFTAPDWTMYPFSTRNSADFYNLLNVYLDSAFFPLIKEESFMQEGHHLVFKEPDDINSDLAISGVVFNEMKGAMSTQSSVMYEKVTEALYPTITYHHNSGGRPVSIPSLKHQDLVEFHKAHYHPSNAWFYTYGNLPLEKHLQEIRHLVLDKFSKENLDTSIPLETRYEEPQSFRFPYPATVDDDLENACQLGVVWLTNPSKDTRTTISMSLLDEMLLGNAASPLRKALIESNLGKSMTHINGYSDDYSETFFGTGLQGVKEENITKVKSLVLDTLAKIAAEGIDPRQVESVIHNYELENRELSSGSYPKGLQYILKCFVFWANGSNPANALDINKIIKELRSNLQSDPRYFESLIQKHLLDNPHRIDVSLFPDTKYNEEQEKEINDILKNLENKIDENDRKVIQSKIKMLSSSQSKVGDESSLPFLSLDNINRKDTFPTPKAIKNDSQLHIYEAETNNLFYYNLLLKLPKLSDEERLLLPAFSLLFNKTGTDRLSYDELSLELNMYTGGIGGSDLIMQCPDQAGNFHDFFLIKGKALERNAEKFIDLSKELYSSFNFSNLERISVLLKQSQSNSINSLIQSGHLYASNAASRTLAPSIQANEIYHGLSHIEAMKEWAKLSGDSLKNFSDKLFTLARKILSTKDYRAFICANKNFVSQGEKLISSFLNEMPKSENSPELNKNFDFKPQLVKEAYCFGTPVSYVSKALPLPTFSHPDSPKIFVTASLLGTNIIHKEIREKGGAYGGKTVYKPSTGVFTFLTYRDPNYKNSLNVFNNIHNLMKLSELDSQIVEEAILTSFRQLDNPLSPVENCVKDFHRNVLGQTVENINEYRERLLSVTKEDIEMVINEYLSQDGSEVGLTSDEKFEKDYGTEAESARPLKIKFST